MAFVVLISLLTGGKGSRLTLGVDFRSRCRPSRGGNSASGVRIPSDPMQDVRP